MGGTVTRMGARLSRLEQMARPAMPPSVKVFWLDELVPGTEHPECVVELETGAHHEDVIHLSFEPRL
jgi:hypothetical protein